MRKGTTPRCLGSSQEGGAGAAGPAAAWKRPKATMGRRIRLKKPVPNGCRPALSCRREKDPQKMAAKIIKASVRKELKPERPAARSVARKPHPSQRPAGRGI